MPPKGYAKKSIKNSSLVPVLFTLGVIGWGFFAIDRLTSSANPTYANDTTEAHDYVADSEKNNKSWKKSAEEFINHFSSSKKIKDEVDPETQNWTVVKEDDNIDQSHEKNLPDIKQKDDFNVNTYYLYYYHENKEQLELSQISRKTNEAINLKNIFKLIISGPAFLHDHNHLIDSFPVKPTVIDAYVKNMTLFLNLDDNFGHGISFETAGLQLEQIIKTASQFKSIHSVQFLINSEEVDSIHVDGLTIPANLKTGRPVVLSRNQEK